MAEGLDIKISDHAKVHVRHDGRWAILYVEDGGGAKTTVSLTTNQALSVAELLKGSAVSAAFAP